MSIKLLDENFVLLKPILTTRTNVFRKKKYTIVKPLDPSFRQSKNNLEVLIINKRIIYGLFQDLLSI